MTVFVALIFQILFVFFAMTINIGLMVHDKINLQNSVDLGAYYGAQKMAETMNAMAHINYQIRQDYKLLAYRLRVVGGLGYDDHPRRRGGPETETPYVNADVSGLAPGCVAFRSWREVRDSQQNICRRQNHQIRELPPLPVIASFIPINALVSSFVNRVRGLITDECKGKSELNWNYVAGSFYAYRIASFKRKEAFKALARNLSAPAEQMLDMDGAPISAGVIQTVQNNLTDANRQGLIELNTFNGLSTVPVGTDLPGWASEILIAPQLFYIFHEGRPGACSNQVRSIRQPAPQIDQSGAFFQSAQGEPNTPTFHSSLGFEKNPWFMAYYGVRATAAPRKPFAPFGAPVRVTARAFAKPFGGRLGPWHKARWARGSPLSGIGVGEVDRLVVPRIAAPGELPNFGAGPQLYPFVPNFSRYPGDALGLTSNLGLIFTPNFRGQENALAVRDFSHFSDMPTPNSDPLSFNPRLVNDRTNPGGVARVMELAAVAPNLFDATYYSIELNFNENFAGRGIWNVLTDSSGQILQVPHDLGSRPSEERFVSIQDQVVFLNAPNRRGGHFYFLSNPQHVLTGWHQSRESNYNLDVAKFGRCQSGVPDNPAAPPNPGNCIVGGRSGYSVKFVSRSYLNFPAHEIGGLGEAAGPILNPPPLDF